MIETERLILGTFREEDTTDLYEYLKEPMIPCFACMKVNSLEEAQSAVQERAKDNEYYFAILNLLINPNKNISLVFSHPETLIYK